jgi:murein DD-endopeptidase MepM/ murein hydrolase activator NlpD
MKKKTKYYPLLEERENVWRRKSGRLAIHLLAAIAFGVLFFAVFSALFDTREEQRIRHSTQVLRHEYHALTRRLAEVEKVLDNVVERDRNVFNILFEAEPYDLRTKYDEMRWRGMESLMGKTNNELAKQYDARCGQLSWQLDDTWALFDDIMAQMAGRGDEVSNIPSIQPILNNDLTLLTASFGLRINPFYKTLTMHPGVDYAVAEGTAVFATADGRVETVVNSAASTGKQIIIDHGNGYRTVYNHLSDILVSRNQRVNRGDLIARTGNTGLSLLPHLHYEIRFRGEAVDPIHFFFGELDPWQYNRIVRISQSGMQSLD